MSSFLAPVSINKYSFRTDGVITIISIIVMIIETILNYPALYSL